MQVSTAGLLLAAAFMVVGCVSESAVFRSPDGQRFFQRRVCRRTNDGRATGYSSKPGGRFLFFKPASH
jgi:hypothetical protein